MKLELCQMKLDCMKLELCQMKLKKKKKKKNPCMELEFYLKRYYRICLNIAIGVGVIKKKLHGTRVHGAQVPFKMPL